MDDHFTSLVRMFVIFTGKLLPFGLLLSQLRAVLMLDSGSTAFFKALSALTATAAVSVAVLLALFSDKDIIKPLKPALGLASCLGI